MNLWRSILIPARHYASRRNKPVFYKQTFPFINCKESLQHIRIQFPYYPTQAVQAVAECWKSYHLLKNVKSILIRLNENAINLDSFWSLTAHAMISDNQLASIVFSQSEVLKKDSALFSKSYLSLYEDYCILLIRKGEFERFKQFQQEMEKVIDFPRSFINLVKELLYMAGDNPEALRSLYVLYKSTPENFTDMLITDIMTILDQYADVKTMSQYISYLLKDGWWPEHSSIIIRHVIKLTSMDRDFAPRVSSLLDIWFRHPKADFSNLNTVKYILSAIDHTKNPISFFNKLILRLDKSSNILKNSSFWKEAYIRCRKIPTDEIKKSSQRYCQIIDSKVVTSLIHRAKTAKETQHYLSIAKHNKLNLEPEAFGVLLVYIAKKGYLTAAYEMCISFLQKYPKLKYKVISWKLLSAFVHSDSELKYKYLRQLEDYVDNNDVDIKDRFITAYCDLGYLGHAVNILESLLKQSIVYKPSSRSLKNCVIGMQQEYDDLETIKLVITCFKRDPKSVHFSVWGLIIQKFVSTHSLQDSKVTIDKIIQTVADDKFVRQIFSSPLMKKIVSISFNKYPNSPWLVLSLFSNVKKNKDFIKNYVAEIIENIYDNNTEKSEFIDLKMKVTISKTDMLNGFNEFGYRQSEKIKQ